MSQPRSRQSWEALASGLEFRSRAFIDGRFVDAASGRTFAATSPIDGRELAQVARCESVDADRAVAAGRRAFVAGDWADAPPKHRKKVLLRLADLMEANADELALLDSLDMGKPVGAISP